MKEETHTQEDGTMPTTCEYKQPAPLVERIYSALLDSGIPEHKVRGEITRITGVSKQNLTHWFNGNTEKPDSDHVIAISNEYNIDLMWLFTGKSQEQYKENRIKMDKETSGSCVNIANAENVYFRKNASGE